MTVFKRLTLAARLAMLFGIVAAVIFAAVAIHLYRSSSEHLRHRDDAAMMDCLDLLGHYIKASPSVEALRSDAHTLLDLTLAQRGVSYAIWTSSGEIVKASTPEIQSLRFQAPSDTIHAPAAMTDWVRPTAATVARVAWTTVQGENGAGEVRVAVVHDDEMRVKMLRAYRVDLLLTTLGAALMTTLLGYAIARRAMKPIKTISITSGVITASQLNNRLRVEDAPAELEEMVRAFNEMLDRLEDSFRRLNQFASDVAHELRTPLSNMMVGTQVMLGRRRSVAEYEALLASNIKEIERLAQIVEGMLFLARVDNPLTLIEKARVDLKAELDKVVECYLPVAQERGLSIECEGEGAVTGDRRLLERAVHNLLSNAVRYASPGGVIEARISRTQSNPWVNLSVTNPGPGIAKEDLAYVFDRFYRTNGARRKSEDGIGLGLAIVKSIVRLHGGEVRLVSEVDKTTTFSIRLPASNEISA